MREPVPTMPVAGSTTMPATRPLSSSWRLLICACSVTRPASIVATAFPSARCAVAVGVPVTTTAPSSITRSCNRIRRFSAPTETRWVAGRNPIRRTSSTTSVPARPLSRKRPEASVATACSAPATDTRASATGESVVEFRTTPDTAPCAARGFAQPAAARTVSAPHANIPRSIARSSLSWRRFWVKLSSRRTAARRARLSPAADAPSPTAQLAPPGPVVAHWGSRQYMGPILDAMEYANRYPRRPRATPLTRSRPMTLARLVLCAAGALALLPSPASGQQEVAGVIVDARSQRPLEGASVSVVGGNIVVRTDARGQFRLVNLSAGEVTLRAALVGYRPVTQSVAAGDATIRIELHEQAINLDEVVVTGTAGDQERRALGNSASTIRAADVQELAPVPDISSLINSRAPGVVVIPGTGQVGAGPRIRIRGMNSLSLNDQPLIYVDGVRVANDVATGIVVQAFGSGVVSRLNDFDPDMIDRIEIIRGPAAATLYGTEAANGVIQIFTKRGRIAERPRVSLSIRQGSQWFMNAEDRIREPINRVCPPGQTTNCPIVAWNPVRQEDSLHALGLVDRPLFTNGYMMGYGLNLSGGTSTARYFSGVAFDRDAGIEPTNKYARFSATATLDITPGGRWDAQASLGFVKSKLDQAFEAGGGGTWVSPNLRHPA